MRDVNLELIKEYAAEDADITFQLYQYFLSHNNLDDKLLWVFNNIEMPLIKVLLIMEKNGIAIDVPFLKNMSTTINVEIERLENKIYELSQTKFNIASPKQLGEILFDKLKINDGQKIVKTKTGQYATDDSILEKIRDKHEIIEPILIYREYSKLKSTYVDALPLLINPQTQRIHTTFNQTRAVTEGSRL